MNVARRTVPAMTPDTDKMIKRCDAMLAECLAMIDGIRGTYAAMQRDTELALHPKAPWHAIAAMNNDEALAALT